MFKQSLCLAALLTLPLLANAATVTLYGDDVKFSYDDSSLFGSATVVGNNIFFLPTAFRAESFNGQSPSPTLDTLNIVAEVTTAGYVMTGFSLLEQGDYRLSTGGTSVGVNTNIQVSSGSALCGPSNTACQANHNVNASGLSAIGSTTEWSASSNINLADTLGWGSDTLATVQVQNTLNASTLNVGEQAWVQKKFIGVAVQTSEVPVPAAFWLFGSALASLSYLRRIQSNR